MSKNIAEPEGPQMTSQHGAYALRAGIARLYARMRMHTPTRPGIQCTHTRATMHTQTNMWYLLLFHNNNSFVNVPHCYVIRTLFCVISNKRTVYLFVGTFPCVQKCTCICSSVCVCICVLFARTDAGIYFGFPKQNLQIDGKRVFSPVEME